MNNNPNIPLIIGPGMIPTTPPTMTYNGQTLADFQVNTDQFGNFLNYYQDISAPVLTGPPENTSQVGPPENTSQGAPPEMQVETWRINFRTIPEYNQIHRETLRTRFQPVANRLQSLRNQADNKLDLINDPNTNAAARAGFITHYNNIVNAGRHVEHRLRGWGLWVGPRTGIFGTVNPDILPTYEGAQHATFLNEPQTTVYLPIQNPNPLYGINLANQFNNAGDISGAGSEDK